MDTTERSESSAGPLKTHHHHHDRLSSSQDITEAATTTMDDDGDFGDFQTFADSTTDESSSAATTLDSPSTCTAASSTPSSSVSSPAHQAATTLRKYPNIYELDMFAFQEFITNFEEQLLTMFVPADGTVAATISPVAKTSSPLFMAPPSASEDLQPFASAFNANTTVSRTALANGSGGGKPKEELSSPIHSQEDIINDCPIWYNLTGSYNHTPPLAFLKSASFKRYLQALNPDGSHATGTTTEKTLKKSKKKFIKAKRSPRTTRLLADLPANMKSRLTLITATDLNDLNDSLEAMEPGESEGEAEEEEETEVSGTSGISQEEEDEDELANDLDMHSLIVGAGSGTGGGSNGMAAKDTNNSTVISADEVIEEIESIMQDGTSSRGAGKVSRSSGSFQAAPPPVTDPMLSLNASSLLDAAIQSWQTAYSMNVDDDDEAAGYHSLPANLNEPLDGDSLQVTAAKSSTNTQQARPSGSTSSAAAPNPPPPPSSNQSNLNKLKQLSIVQLNELYMELEQIIQLRSEILISELALRDELEFEKELKNQFISLLLSVQNKRRYYTANGGSPRHTARSKVKTSVSSSKHNLIRRNSAHGSSTATDSSTTPSRLISRATRLDFASIGSSLRESFRFTGGSGSNSNSANGPSGPVYLTTVIPYRSEMNPVDTPTLQMLIKLLTAMDEDSSTVPALLTDYILKVICP